jgi:hypothetical protein
MECSNVYEHFKELNKYVPQNLYIRFMTSNDLQQTAHSPNQYVADFEFELSYRGNTISERHGYCYNYSTARKMYSLGQMRRVQL